MKLERNKDIDYSSTMDLEGYDSEIDLKDLHKMFSMFQNPYKNNIGSIVREITSNCFDSHAEAGVNDAVIVKIDKDDSGWYISFIDVGVGLSPDRIKNIYVKYLSSTKEDSNDFIGAFGIGSKSPLSYQNMFFINTRYEGVEYQYMMRVGEIKPKIEKLDEFDTTERNGTEIKMYIKKGEASDTNYRLGDLGKFVNECNKQLFYFDNVYFQINPLLEEAVKGNNSYLNNVLSNFKDSRPKNGFKLYETDIFKFRPNETSYPFKTMHICLGKVAYPIDWDQLGMTPINAPIALNFNIGELTVIQTREDIKYTEENIAAIKEKINLFIKALIDKYNSLDIFESDDLTKFSTHINDVTYGYYVNKLPEPYNMFNSQWYNDMLTQYTGSKLLFNFKNLTRNSTVTKVPALLPNGEDMDVKVVVFKPLIDSELDFEFDLFGYNRYPVNMTIEKYINRSSKNINKYTKYELMNIGSIWTKVLSNGAFKVNDYSELENKTNKYVAEADNSGLDIPIIEAKPKSLKGYINTYNLDYIDKSKWRAYIKFVQEYIEKPYEDKIKDYNAIKPLVTDAWWKQWRKDNYNTVGTVDKKFSYRNYSFYDNGDRTRSISTIFCYDDVAYGYSNQVSITLEEDKELKEYDQFNGTDITYIYASHDDKQLMCAIRDYLIYKEERNPEHKYKLFTVAKTKQKMVENEIDNSISAKDFVEENIDDIAEVLAAYELKNSGDDSRLLSITDRVKEIGAYLGIKLSDEFNSLKDKIRIFNKHYNSSRVKSDPMTILLEYAQKNTEDDLDIDAKKAILIDKYEKERTDNDSVISKLEFLATLIKKFDRVDGRDSYNAELFIKILETLDIIAPDAPIREIFNISGPDITLEDVQDASYKIATDYIKNNNILNTNDEYSGYSKADCFVYDHYSYRIRTLNFPMLTRDLYYSKDRFKF